MGSTLDIYTEHFGLGERPFSLVPDPDFMYWSPSHKRAYSMLEYGILTRAPITLITGEVGAGKTTLLHHLLKSLDDDIRIGLIANAHGDRGELLRWVLLALEQPAAPEHTYVDLFGQFQTFLIGEYAAGRRVILIFDEAQNLSRESLEELRMFTNINSNKDDLLQLVLVGQPELRDIVRRPDLTQFAQRVAANFHLSAMDGATVKAYVQHRLSVAGGKPGIFAESTFELIHGATGGVPRLVNQLCDLSLVYAFTANQQKVMRRTVLQVLQDGVFFAGGQELPTLTGAPATRHAEPATPARPVSEPAAPPSENTHHPDPQPAHHQPTDVKTTPTNGARHPTPGSSTAGPSTAGPSTADPSTAGSSGGDPRAVTPPPSGPPRHTQDRHIQDRLTQNRPTQNRPGAPKPDLQGD